MKYLILDIGGVLVYPRLGQWHIPYRAADILGPERAKDLRTGRFDAALRGCMSWLREDRLVMDVDTERQLRRGFVLELDRLMGWRMTDGEICAMTDDFTDDPERYGWFDDVRAYLQKWSGQYTLALLSDAMPSILDFVEQYGVRDLFREIVISTHVGATKPDPKMYRTLLQRLNADPNDCLFVDDRAVNLRGAVDAGMRAVQMDRAQFPADPLWDGAVVHDFAELNDLL